MQLIENVIKWGEDRHIHAESTYQAQLNGAVAEWFEMREAIIKEKPLNEIAMEIGDVLVQFTNAFMISKHYNAAAIIRDLLNSDRANKSSDIEKSTEWFIESMGSRDIWLALLELKAVANAQGLILTDCYQLAYNKISKRTGAMKNGKWCKHE
jgi:hypothetical protein